MIINTTVVMFKVWNQIIPKKEKRKIILDQRLVEIKTDAAVFGFLSRNRTSRKKRTPSVEVDVGRFSFKFRRNFLLIIFSRCYSLTASGCLLRRRCNDGEAADRRRRRHSGHGALLAKHSFRLPWEDHQVCYVSCLGSTFVPELLSFLFNFIVIINIFF